MSNSLAKNFEEIFDGLTTYAATVEANRCLYCYDPPCVKACPTSINIPSFIKKIASNNMKGSARVIMEANPVGASCARVCPTIELCEGACVLNSEEKPIQIGHLQRYATDWLRESDVNLFTPKPANGKKIAIIGSGPAGLSAARELALLGYGVTIYEADEKAGGLNYYGIVSFRLPQDVVEWEVQQVQNLGVEIKTSTKIGEDVLVDDLLANFDRIIVAVGMGKVPMLNIEGEHLEGVYDAIDFVKESKASFTDKMLGKKAVVIGAGNTAIDAATCSVRLGAEQVQIVYRRTSKEMTAYDFEYDFAKQDGVEFRWLSLPKRVIGDEAGKVIGLECIKMKLTDIENGKGTLTEIPGSEFVIETDAVIRAIGQAKQYELIEHLGLANTRGVIDVEMNSLKTSNPKIYACGDVIYGNGYGEATVVSAAQQGKDSAYAIHYELNANSEIA
ncbi:NAD(P)-dependent oxidoreductase [Solibacillus merdavium]|uniref:dihydrouracil dehydrogenase (NAD(+)) n=1 Tax=Solibacillus merdavium TaxID=2762218 RepID=A0ABR8XPH8_9BACL|nr:NAD(P)-dependent oxidoreductase [Solibacillus merdavium]MBD8033854.1 NAD(P)-dependent oxidoreductase [Solibacillus merdavium]